MSTSTSSSATSISASRWASVSPTLPAPSTAILWTPDIDRTFPGRRAVSVL